MSCLLAGCTTISENEISSASSQKLCTKVAYLTVSEENREQMYKELESRGHTCLNQYVSPPPQTPQRRQSTTTNCTRVGDNVNCTTR
jgi:hypothetical protein